MVAEYSSRIEIVDNRASKLKLRKMKTTGLLFIALFASSPLAFAKDKLRTPRDQSVQAAPLPVAVAVSETKPHEPWVKVDVAIAPREREIIQNHVTVVQDAEVHAHSPRGLPPGLARKRARGRELPPGWQKKVVVGLPMPEEVFKVCQPLPQEVVVKLPPPPAGTILVRVEGKVVRLLEGTREILDVFDVRL